MPYINLVFHNTRHGGASINVAAARANYTNNFVGAMNVFQSNAGAGATAGWVGGAGGIAPPSAAWGPSATGGANAYGIFLCESPPYAHMDYNGWRGTLVPLVPSAIPAFPVGYLASGYTPFNAVNTLCAFWVGQQMQGEVHLLQ